MSTLTAYWNDKAQREQQKIIKQYELKIDVLNKQGAKLVNQINILDYQVDSLKQVKMKILYKKYEEKADIINDATAAEHAQWVDSVLIELERSGNYK